MTKEERRVKKYIDAWCEEKRVTRAWGVIDNGCLVGYEWIDIEDMEELLRHLGRKAALRIVKGKRV